MLLGLDREAEAAMENSLLAIEFGETKPEEPINPHSTGAKSESH